MSDCFPGFPPSSSNTTVLAVNASSSSVATDLAAAVAVDTTTVPHAKLAAATGRQIPVGMTLIFSSSQNGRIALGASDMPAPGATGGQPVLAGEPYEIPVTPGRRYFRFTNESGSATANISWTNPNRA